LELVESFALYASTAIKNARLHQELLDQVEVRKKANLVLKESEKKFRSVIEQSNDGIYVLQKDRFVFINPRFSKLSGYNFEELSQEDFKFRSMFTEKGYKVIKEREQNRSLGKKLPGRFTFEGLRKNGIKRIWEVNVTEIEWEGNKATLGILQDVTTRIIERKELEKALEKAHNANEVKNLFLANMSHEIRTPLNTILGFTDIIKETSFHAVGEEEKGFYDIIETSGERLMHTVHEVLDISQIEAGTYVQKIEKFNLVPLVRMLVDEMKILSNKKKLILEFQSSRKQAIINADRDGISKSISNIIENAIKYTEKGKITISLKQNSKHVILEIRDTGIGMSKEYLGKIFEAFTQESEGYTKKYQGLGLGMAIVKGHLELNQVDITVKSTKGKGTIFTITFPKTEKIRIEQTKGQEKDIIS